MSLPKLSRYHIAVLCMYLLLVLTIVTQFPSVLKYESNASWSALLIVGITLLCFFFLILFFRNRESYRVHRELSFILYATGYAFAFAIPEEILFRGLIQGFALASFAPVFSILISSLIFGLAHIVNNAKGINPLYWNWQLAGISFVGGVPLGILFLLTGSLLLPTMLHALFLLVSQLFLSD